MKDIRELSNEEWEVFLKNAKQPKFRKKQVEQWLWEKGVESFEDMRNIPAALLEALQTEFVIKQICFGR
jgi:23S rRNA (adenine2503-C2)-methyltransferase